MASSVGKVDLFVKDYLLFRGFTTALKGLEYDLKNDKDKGFRSDLICDQLIAYVNGFELTRLLEYWSYLDRRLFSRLELQHAASTRKLYSSLLKLYLVNCVQNMRSDKLQEFFERMTHELLGQNEWKEWFALPFLKQPDSTPGFEAYFSKQWQDALALSLHNYISLTLQCMPLPALLNVDAVTPAYGVGVDEKDGGRRAASDLGGDFDSRVRKQQRPEARGLGVELKSSMELMDDFYSLTQSMVQVEDPASSSKVLHAPTSGAKASLMKSLTAKSSAPPTSASAAKASQDRISRTKPASTASTLPVVSMVMAFQQAAAAALPGGAASLASVSQQRPAKVSNSGASGMGGEQQEKKRHSFLESLLRKVPDPARLEESCEDLPTVNAATSKGYVSSGEGSIKEVEMTPVAKPASAAVKADEALDVLASDVFSTLSLHNVVECGEGGFESSPFHLLSQEEYSEHGSSVVTHCKFSRSGHTIVSADASAVVKVWTLNPSPVTIASIIAKSALVSVEWVDSADKLLLIGCVPDVVRLYDVKEKKTVTDKNLSSELFISRLLAMAVAPAGDKFACSSSLAFGGGSHGEDSGELMFWDLRTMEREQGLGDNVSVTTMSYSHDGRLLIAGCADGTMRAIDVVSGACVRRWNAHDGRVCSLYVSRDNGSCYTVGIDTWLYEWSLGNTNERLSAVSLQEATAGPFLWPSAGTANSGVRPGQSTTATQCARDRLFAFDSREAYMLTCGSRGGCVYKMSKESMLEKTMTLGGHRAPVVAVDWSGVDTETCLTADMAGKVRLSTLLSKEAWG